MSQQQRDAEEDARSRSARICFLPFFFFTESQKRARADALQKSWMEKVEAFLSRSTEEEHYFFARTC